jgi:hypothetical protein
VRSTEHKALSKVKYIAEQIHKCEFVDLCMNNKFTLMHGVEHTKFVYYSVQTNYLKKLHLFARCINIHLSVFDSEGSFQIRASHYKK